MWMHVKCCQSISVYINLVDSHQCIIIMYVWCILLFAHVIQLWSWNMCLLCKPYIWRRKMKKCDNNIMWCLCGRTSTTSCMRRTTWTSSQPSPDRSWRTSLSPLSRPTLSRRSLKYVQLSYATHCQVTVYTPRHFNSPPQVRAVYWCT